MGAQRAETLCVKRSELETETQNRPPENFKYVAENGFVCNGYNLAQGNN